jgi:pyruvate, orthophosphate dikinase
MQNVAMVTAHPRTKWVYRFRKDSAATRDLLGGKGAGLAEMASLGIPVPPGFTITTEACRAYYAAGGVLADDVWEQVLTALAETGRTLGRCFGDARQPLLVSVRSGARVSMPGMMDTVLNLGVNEDVVAGIARETGDTRFALDAYRRLIQMFGSTVRGIPDARFDAELARARARAGVRSDAELTAPQLDALVRSFLRIYHKAAGEFFPRDPMTQLRAAIEAVFRSWNGDRAIAYRRMEHIPDDIGTAVNVQAMVFGNLGESSGTGVVFTRDPNSGAPGLYGDYLPAAQGEDVVAGIRATRPIAELAVAMPPVYAELTAHATLLEKHYGDVQDLEFTIERGRLWLLQTRTAKRTGEAAVRAAVDMAGEGLITRRQAVLRVEPHQLEQLLHRRIDPGAQAHPIATGVGAAPGAATGVAVFDPDTAAEWGGKGKAVILVRVVTSPDDVHGMAAAKGILTATGGTLSHAAVVARGMGLPCVVGASDVDVDEAGRKLTAGGVTIRAGDELTIDGGTGNVYLGAVPMVPPTASPTLQTLLGWADEFRRLGVRANADYPRDAEVALANGAEGIGLCRTEHMFMEADRLPVVQAMIMARSTGERERQLARLLPMQRGDFRGILAAMAGRPVIIRLIDPPLHEFLPDHDSLLQEVATLRATGAHPRSLARLERVLHRVDELREANPMMGLRGCRLSILFPEIVRMQVRAILEAACELRREGVDARPEIMVPLVGTEAELLAVKADLEPVARAVQEEQGIEVPYQLGTMIEVPRAVFVAGEIARHVSFFSFGTNDLTQMTFGYSRDDAEGKFIGRYVERGILPANPFETLDSAVLRMMEMAVTAGRQVQPGLEVGVCGEHGGDPDSVVACHRLGLDYVSCSPYRVPVARLAAAQAAL